MVAPVVPTGVPEAVDTRDEEMRDSGNLSVYEATHIPVSEGARSTHLPRVPWCTTCCRARRIDDSHHVVTHDESVDSLPKIECDYAEIKMKRDATPMRVLLVVDSSTGYLGATDVDQESGSSGFAAKWVAKWLESTGSARMTVQSDAEQSIEHLSKAVVSIRTADLVAQRAPVKSHAS